MTTTTRWALRIGGALVALIVIAIWRGIDRDVGAGWGSGAVRGVLLIAFVIWLWSVTRDKTSIQSAAAPEATPLVGDGSSAAEDAPKNDQAPSSAWEEELYEQASGELYGPTRRPGLWAKAFADAGGNESQAQALYLKMRVEQLANERRIQLQEAKGQREER